MFTYQKFTFMLNKYQWQFYHWHIEPSSKCALRCPRCPRVEHPNTPWLNQELSIDDFKKVFNKQMLSNVKRFTMCGDVGDPIYCKDYLKIIEYIKNYNQEIEIFTITNGGYKTEDWWKQFAKLSNKHDTINFSIDGYDQESNNLYRVNNNFESSMKGMKICAEDSEMFVNWALIVFKFNQNNLEQIKQLATRQGCDALQITYSTKFGSKYGEAYGGNNDELEPDSKYISKSHRYERQTVELSGRKPIRLDYLKENFKKFIEIKNQYKGEIVPMCLIGNRGLYLNAEGVIFPCSWTSFPYKSLEVNGKTIHWKDSFFAKHRSLLNTKGNRTIEEILNDELWQKLFDSFNDTNKNWVECMQKCNKHIVDKQYSIGYYTN
jgi:MoaA/NifB/PqqE/SkfB family radical SAM enzyme